MKLAGEEQNEFQIPLVADSVGARTVNEWFRRSSLGSSTRPAVSFFDAQFGWHTWSYASLAARVQEVAVRLLRAGISPRESVGLVATRQPESIVGMLAILKCGGCYVPLDLAYPLAHVRALCETAGVRRVLAPERNPASAMLPSDLTIIQVPRDPAYLENADAVDTMDVADAETPAYVMFTSGSTGVPKGVVVPHRAIVRLVIAANFMTLDESTVFLQLAPLSFDASTLEIWGPLLNGGHCVLYPEGALPTSVQIHDVIRSTGVNALWLTSSLFNAIVDSDVSALADLRFLLSGGEALSVPHVARARKELSRTTLVNGYGPTENTTFTTYFEIPADFGPLEKEVPIGYPVAGTTTLVVDESLTPVPDGVEGELLALGDGLALGYLGQPALSAARFVRIAVAGGATMSAYRTGDRVIRTSEGLHLFRGRTDEQVKIEGHRIEPAEIEYAIRSLPEVRDCRVLVTRMSARESRLVAYIVSDEANVAQGIRKALQERLPRYMLPSSIVQIPVIPLNENGKLDRKALPDPFKAVSTPRVQVTDSTTLRGVRAAWEEVLGRSGIEDDVSLFDAGGTSLEAIRLQEALLQRFGDRVGMMFVFEYPTMARQAIALERAEKGRPESGHGLDRRRAAELASRRRR